MSDLGEASSRLCSLLKIDVPIIQAPMAGGWVPPELVAAVSNAGGLGMLAAARISLEQLQQQIARVRQLTAKPFGVNFVLAPPEPFDGDDAGAQRALDAVRERMGLPKAQPGKLTLPPSPLADQFAFALEHGVPIISFAMGRPDAFMDRARHAGTRMIGSATSVAEARDLAALGVDAIVAQGSEAGGHRMTHTVDRARDLPLVGTMALVPQVVDAVTVPVIAAGGIMDGRGVAAALALGASGVQMGTRFLTARESAAFPEYRQRLKSAADTDTVVSNRWTGRPARGLRSPMLDELERSGVAALPWPYQGAAAEDIFRAAGAGGRGDYFPLLAGQAAALAQDEPGAGELVQALAAGAREVLGKLRIRG